MKVKQYSVYAAFYNCPMRLWNSYLNRRAAEIGKQVAQSDGLDAEIREVEVEITKEEWAEIQEGLK